MTMTDCELFDGYNCSLYPKCSCTGFFNRENEMKERCSDCKTFDTCNRTGCINEIKNSVRDIYTMPYTKSDTDCPLPICGTPAICQGGCILKSVEDKAPELDGRNESPLNQHGCSYVDCDCVVPCTSASSDKANTTVINITINGDNYGDIIL